VRTPAAHESGEAVQGWLLGLPFAKQAVPAPLQAGVNVRWFSTPLSVTHRGFAAVQLEADDETPQPFATVHVGVRVVSRALVHESAGAVHVVGVGVGVPHVRALAQAGAYVV
jgi:hypothetical protein